MGAPVRLGAWTGVGGPSALARGEPLRLWHSLARWCALWQWTCHECECGVAIARHRGCPALWQAPCLAPDLYRAVGNVFAHRRDLYQQVGGLDGRAAITAAPAVAHSARARVHSLANESGNTSSSMRSKTPSDTDMVTEVRAGCRLRVFSSDQCCKSAGLSWGRCPTHPNPGRHPDPLASVRARPPRPLPPYPTPGRGEGWRVGFRGGDSLTLQMVAGGEGSRTGTA